MDKFIISGIVGIVLIVIGIMNIGGNVSFLHSYHRKRVSEENVKPFGKIVGIANIIMGVSLIVLGIFSAITYFNEQNVYELIGLIIFAVGLFTGLGMSFYAMRKYNKGIF